MSTRLEIVRDRPVIFLSAPKFIAGGVDQTTYLDYSGFGNDFTASGADFPGPAPVDLAAGAGGHSGLAYNSKTVQGTNVLMDADNRLPSSYSYEAWVRAFGTPAQEQVIFGFANGTYIDGLTIEGTIVRFRIKYDNADDTILAYDTEFPQALHIVANHTREKDQLWINNELVVEQNTSIEQQADTHKSASNSNVYIGSVRNNPTTHTVAVTQRFQFNAIAVYTQALSPDVINRHYLMGTNVSSSDSIVSGWHGEKFDLGVDSTTPLIDQTFSTEADWKLGHGDNIRIVDDYLMPIISDNVSLGAQWIRNVYLGGYGVSDIDGVNFDWTGSGVTVAVSLNGTSWEEVVKFNNITLVPEGFNPSGVNLYIRVTFDAGTGDDDFYMESLRMVVYRPSDIEEKFGRLTTITGGHRLRNYEPISQHDNWGVRLDSGGSVTVSSSSDPSSPDVHAVEVWMKDGPTTSLDGIADSILINDDHNSPTSLIGGGFVPDPGSEVVHSFIDIDLGSIYNINNSQFVGPGFESNTPSTSDPWDILLTEYLSTNGLAWIGDGKNTYRIEVDITGSPTSVQMYSLNGTGSVNFGSSLKYNLSDVESIVTSGATRTYSFTVGPSRYQYDAAYNEGETYIGVRINQTAGASISINAVRAASISMEGGTTTPVSIPMSSMYPVDNAVYDSGNNWMTTATPLTNAGYGFVLSATTPIVDGSTTWEIRVDCQGLLEAAYIFSQNGLDNDAWNNSFTRILSFVNYVIYNGDKNIFTYVFRLGPGIESYNDQLLDGELNIGFHVGHIGGGSNPITAVRYAQVNDIGGGSSGPYTGPFYGVSDMQDGLWYRVVYNMTTSFDDDIVITGPGQIGYVALYAEPYTDDIFQYVKQYYQYTGDFFERHTATNPMVMAQDAVGTKVYTADWTIQAS